MTVAVVAYEQPTLRARYGASYDAYCRTEFEFGLALILDGRERQRGSAAG